MKRPAKTVRVSNKYDMPRDFMVEGKNYHLEPKGSKGDSISIEKRIIEHKDFKHLKSSFVIKEAL